MALGSVMQTASASHANRSSGDPGSLPFDRGEPQGLGVVEEGCIADGPVERGLTEDAKAGRDIAVGGGDSIVGLIGGNVGGAIEAATRAVDLNPRNIDAMMLMGRLVRDQYGLIAALPWFEGILTLDPNTVPAMVQAAATLGEAGMARVHRDIARCRDVLAALGYEPVEQLL